MTASTTHRYIRAGLTLIIALTGLTTLAQSPAHAPDEPGSPAIQAAEEPRSLPIIETELAPNPQPHPDKDAAETQTLPQTAKPPAPTQPPGSAPSPTDRRSANIPNYTPNFNLNADAAEKYVDATITAYNDAQRGQIRQLGIENTIELALPTEIQIPEAVARELLARGLDLTIQNRFLVFTLEPDEANLLGQYRPDSVPQNRACDTYQYGGNGDDVAIPDDPDDCNTGDAGYTFTSFSITGLEGYTICQLTYRARLLHTWPGDLLIQINNDSHPFEDGLDIWNRLGGDDDGGYDDDDENDDDIYLNHRLTHFFDGDPVNNTWYLDVWDNCPADTGTIDYLELHLYYEYTPQPDLVVDDIWLDPPNPYPGQSVDINTNICNIGDAGTGLVNIALHYYVDGDYVGNDTIWWGLGQGECADEVQSFIAPDCGNRNICVIVDPSNNIPESDEGNNQRCESHAWNCYPDLIGWDCYAPAEAHWGETIEIEYQVRNQDAGDTAAFRNLWRLDTDTSWGGTYYTFGYSQENPINGNTFGPDKTAYLPLPENPPPGFPESGTFYIQMYSDYYGDITESDEANNYRAALIYDYDVIQLADAAQAPDAPTFMSTPPASLYPHAYPEPASGPYEISVDYTDPNGRQDLYRVYLTLINNNGGPNILVYVEPNSAVAAAIDDRGYLTDLSATSQEITNGYRINYSFKFLETWTPSDAVDYAASAEDFAGLASPETPYDRNATYDNALRVYDARIDYVTDNDDDGYYSSLNLEWDADTSLSARDVYAKVYAYHWIGGDRFIGQSATYTIYGNALDWYEFPIDVQQYGLDHRRWDLRIELHDDNDIVAVFYDKADDTHLEDVQIELPTEDDLQSFNIYDVEIVNPDDQDLDGCPGLATIRWDADVSSGSADVRGRVYKRAPNGIESLVGDGNCYTITGNEYDWYTMDLEVTGACGDWDFRVELWNCDNTQLLAGTPYGDDPDLMDFALEGLEHDGGSCEPVTITSHPISRTACLGEMVNLSVHAQGTAPIEYQWRKDGIDITGANSASYVIEEVQLLDAGLYECIVTNCAGTVEAVSDPAFIEIQLPPCDHIVHQYGQLEIIADHAFHREGNVWEYSGNVQIGIVNGPHARVEGLVEADTATLIIRGEGGIWIDDIPGIGTLQIYGADDGGPREWEFDGNEALTNFINEALSGFRPAGLEFHVTRIGFVGDAIHLEGYILLPDSIGEGRIDIEGDHFIEISRSQGVTFDILVDVPELSVDIGGLPLAAEDASLHISNTLGYAYVRLVGLYALPELLGGFVIDLSEDEGNYIQIIAPEGTPEIEIVGSLFISGPIPLGPGFALEDLLLVIDMTEHIVRGQGVLMIPAGFGIGAGVGFRDGYFDYVFAGAYDMNIVLLTGPPPFLVPIIVLQDVSAAVENIAPGPPPVILHGAMAFTGGPSVGDYYLVRLDLLAEYDTRGRFTGIGIVSLGGGDEPYEMANGMIIIDRVYGVYMEGHLTFVDVLDIDGQLRLDLENNLQGNLVGSLHAPEWLFGGPDLANVQMYAQYYDDEDYDNDYIIGAIRLVFWEHAVSFDFNDAEIDWFADMDLIHEVEIPPPPGGKGPREPAPAFHEFAMAPNTRGTVFESRWDEHDTQINLIRPDGTVITPADVDQHDDIMYAKDPVGRRVYYVVNYPEAGTWQIEVASSNTIGGYAVRELTTNTAPSIGVLEPSADTTENEVEIRWVDSDSDSAARVSLYYDTDRDGADGTLIVANLDEDDPANAYVWNTAGVPSGTYYVYAKIDDGQNAPVVDYSLGRVTVVDPLAPAAPTGLAAARGLTGGSLRLSWTPVAGDIDHYEVFVTEDAAGELYPTQVSAGAESYTILPNLVVGQQYRLAVAAVDTEGRRGPASEPIVVTMSGVVNSNPVFVGTLPTQATIGVLYEHQVLALDRDEQVVYYALAYEPDGMTVTSGGLLRWTPTAEQIGLHEFELTIYDGVGGGSVRRFTIHVSPPDVRNRAPEILSEAEALVLPGSGFAYQVVASDPDVGDALSYDLLAAPSGAAIDGTGLLTYGVPGGHGRYEFFVRVRDGSNLFDVQRFTVVADAEAPQLPAEWAEVVSPAPGVVEVYAADTADACGPVEFQLEVDGEVGPWNVIPQWRIEGLLANAAYEIRLRARDASASGNVTDWTGVRVAYTQAATPGIPVLVAAEPNAIRLALAADENPSSTEYAIWSALQGVWVDPAGGGSAAAVWAEQSSWADVLVVGLPAGRAQHFQAKARNAVLAETPLSVPLTARTLAPDAHAEVTSSSSWLVENEPGSSVEQVTMTAVFVNDPLGNDDYSYSWEALEHPVTGLSLVLVSGGGSGDSEAVFAAPEGMSADVVPYEVRCTITGADTGNYVSGTAYVTVLTLGDVNCDGVLNNFDIDPFVTALTDPAEYALLYPDCDISLADVNGDGTVNNFDIDVFVDLLSD